MGRWKSRGGKSQRGEEKKREDQRRERVRRKMQVREKVGKSQTTVFFQWCVASGGRKVGGCGAIWPDERWKIACRCGAKHISKSKCAKHTCIGTLLVVEMSKKCTPLWREAYFQVNMLKTPHAWTTFESSDVVLRGSARDCAPCQKSARRWGFCSSFNYNHYTTLYYITLHYNYDYNYHITLHYTTLRYTTLITSHDATLHYTTPQ